MVESIATLVAVVALTACTASDAVEVPVRPSTAPVPSTTATDPYEGEFAVLTGEEVSAQVADRRVVVVPLAAGAAWRGVDAADLVVVEAPAGRVRTLALFQSSSPREVGPVGPLRPLAGKVATTARAFVAAHGGDKFQPGILALGQLDVSSASAVDAYEARGSERFVRPQRLWSRPDGAVGAAALLAFAHGDDAFATTGARAATSLRVVGPGGRSWQWRFDAVAGVWEPAAGSTPCPTAQSVVVQEVRFKQLRVDAAGTVEPAAQVLGKGEATVVSGGLTVRTTWSRPNYQSITNFADASGTPVRLRPGRTCVVLVPPGTAVSAA